MANKNIENSQPTNIFCCCNTKQNSNTEEYDNVNINTFRGNKSLAGVENMDSLMDMALSTKRPTIFVPISPTTEFSSTCNKINILTVIHPFSTFRFIWDSFIMLVLVFTCFEIPLTLSFEIETSNIHSAYGIFVLIIDLILCTDIIFNFRTGFYDKYDELKLVSDPNKIAKTYFKHWFVIDFITSFPIDFLLPSEVELGGAPTILRAFRIVRLVRLFKLVRFFRMLKLVNTFLREFMGSKSALVVRLLKLVAYMILAAHFAACMWYYVGITHYDENDPSSSWLMAQDVDIKNKLDSYVISIYWAVVTLFTTGYGDIIPVNKYEQLVAGCVILLGTCFFAYLIGAVGSLVAEGDRARSVREQKFEEAQAFCASKNLPPILSRKIITHISYFWKKNFIYDDFEILQSLPFTIQYEILNICGNKMFTSFKPFDDLPNTTKGLLSLKLKKFSMNKGCYVYQNDDIAKEFYVQRTGKSLLVYDNRNIALKRGDIFGHIGFVKGKRKGALLCETFCEFYSLSKRDLEEVLMLEHPQKWEHMLNKIMKNMKLYKPHKNKMSIDLNNSYRIHQRKNSKFMQLFTEDSIERNHKILFDYVPNNETNVELTERITPITENPYNDSSSNANGNSDASSNASGNTDSEHKSDSDSHNEINNGDMIIPKKKQNNMVKKRRIGKQGGGSRNTPSRNTRNTGTQITHKYGKKTKKKKINKHNSVDNDEDNNMNIGVNNDNILSNRTHTHSQSANKNKNDKNQKENNININVEILNLGMTPITDSFGSDTKKKK
eukprot:278753_1